MNHSTICECGISGAITEGRAKIFVANKRANENQLHWDYVQCPTGKAWHCYDKERCHRDQYLERIRNGSLRATFERQKKQKEERAAEASAPIYAEQATESCQKVSYGSKKVADAGAKATGPEAHSYECPHCQKWHITSRVDEKFFHHQQCEREHLMTTSKPRHKKSVSLLNSPDDPNRAMYLSIKDDTSGTEVILQFDEALQIVGVLSKLYPKEPSP